ncbi:MAG TPA: ABC transporter ATP-binding protein [Polyangiaceae bacterium]|nr:ABC transporter ATP-binding protein [Polyangiaceae bacterium]
MDDAITVSELRVIRNGRVVVDRVSFGARSGMVTGLLGPNGAGKSSIIKALAGIVPYEGDVWMDGQLARKLDGPSRARRIGYVPQQTELRSGLSVEAVVTLGRYAHYVGQIRSTDGDRASVARAMALTEIEPLSGRSFLTLSQGERQRVLIARALASDARILLLDEPTAALDISHALKIYALMRRLAQRGYCILAVLHALENAMDWTDEAILLDRGRIVARGSTREILSAEMIATVYDVCVVPNGAPAFRLAPARPNDGWEGP